jgi:hypothetical protein
MKIGEETQDELKTSISSILKKAGIVVTENKEPVYDETL